MSGKLVIIGPLQADVPVLFVVDVLGLRKVLVLLQQNPVEALLLLPYKDLLCRPLQVDVGVLLLRGFPHKHMIQRPLQVDMGVPLLRRIPHKDVLLWLLQVDVTLVLFLLIFSHKDVFVGAAYPRMALPPILSRLAWWPAPASSPRIWRIVVRLSPWSASRSRYIRRLAWIALVALVALDRICWVALVPLLAFC